MQDPDDFLPISYPLLVEQGLDVRPREKIRMYDLVCVAPKNKIVRPSQVLEDEVHLYVRDILNLIDHGEIVGGLDPGKILKRQEVHVVETGLPEKREVPFKEGIGPDSLTIEKNRLPHTEAEIIVVREAGAIHGTAGQ